MTSIIAVAPQSRQTGRDRSFHRSDMGQRPFQSRRLNAFSPHANRSHFRFQHPPAEIAEVRQGLGQLLNLLKQSFLTEILTTGTHRYAFTTPCGTLEE
jgi:hypothetical protein